MKCWHLVAAIALAGCGLNTTALPSTGRGGDDAGVDVADADASIATSPANWPTRRRPTRLEKDGGSSDTKDAAKPSGGGPATSDKDAQTDPTPAGPTTNPSGGPNNPSQPAGGPAKPGNQAQPSTNGQSGNGQNSNGQSGNGQSGNGQSGNGQSGSAPDAGDPDTGSSGTDDPDGDSASDEDDGSDEGDHGDDNDDDHGGNGSQSPGSSGHGGQPHSDDAVSVIVDLVIAILDLSLGPVRPAEIEALVSSILVLSLAPAELAAESLVAVLDALEETQICLDHPERCNPLCTNLESDCSACGRDEECIERIEEMCKVKLPKTCL